MSVTPLLLIQITQQRGPERKSHTTIPALKRSWLGGEWGEGTWVDFFRAGLFQGRTSPGWGFSKGKQKIHAVHSAELGTKDTPRIVCELNRIELNMLPELNPKSYDGARVLEASGRPMLVIGRSSSARRRRRRNIRSIHNINRMNARKREGGSDNVGRKITKEVRNIKARIRQEFKYRTKETLLFSSFSLFFSTPTSSFPLLLLLEWFLPPLHLVLFNGQCASFFFFFKPLLACRIYLWRGDGQRARCGYGNWKRRGERLPFLTDLAQPRRPQWVLLQSDKKTCSDTSTYLKPFRWEDNRHSTCHRSPPGYRYGSTVVRLQISNQNSRETGLGKVNTMVDDKSKDPTRSQTRKERSQDTYLACVKGHKDIKGNEAADKLSKWAATLRHECQWEGAVTLAGLKFLSRRVRAGARRGNKTGPLGWGRRALSAYTWCLPNRGPHNEWLFKIRKADPDQCRCRLWVMTGTDVGEECTELRGLRQGEVEEWGPTGRLCLFQHNFLPSRLLP